MITITIENKDNQIRLKVEGDGKSSDLIKEAIFLIDRTADIYDVVIDNLPIESQFRVMHNVIDMLKEKKERGQRR